MSEDFTDAELRIANASSVPVRFVSGSGMQKELALATLISDESAQSIIDIVCLNPLLSQFFDVNLEMIFRCAVRCLAFKDQHLTRRRQ
ncbi:hypothetical protein COL26b_009895 [Colletotrichum chrysophilum]|uniref:uncharacterized protein n=1 Tax=Colletotrichum chrysophilum TaxID=1836956 RepID=UPI002300F683|nr:uncharacterized protein COL26b_009895 [Colletotrichum chrysophilum]KAJ0370604.1 hypothetical protein COL26b_009895 [Colletotrichum chrysophilum]